MAEATILFFVVSCYLSLLQPFLSLSVRFWQEAQAAGRRHQTGLVLVAAVVLGFITVVLLDAECSLLCSGILLSGVCPVGVGTGWFLCDEQNFPH